MIIAHDIDTSRVFGVDHDITKTNFNGVLDQLLTLEEPRSKIPTFDELLQWCIKVNDQNGFNQTNDNVIKLMLDIKVDNDPIILYDLIWDSFNKFKGVDYWKDKIIFGIWRDDFYIPSKLDDFKVINIAFDFMTAQKVNEAVKSKTKNSKLYGVSLINLSLQRQNEKDNIIQWAKNQTLKLWFWTVNTNQELKEIIEAFAINENCYLLEGVVTDNPIALKNESAVKNYGYVTCIKFWFKLRLYGTFLYFLRRGYNLSTVFVILKKIGFI